MHNDILASLRGVTASLPRVAVAISGGVDSMALALLLKETGANLVALTVDHSLRPEAKKEAESVSRQMKKLGVTHATLTVEAKRPASGNTMEWAREQRYQLLTDYCKKHKIPALFVAHHLDDNIETFFLNLERGSGLRGLSGMQEISEKNGVKIIRPLLSVFKEELAAYLKSKKIKPINDPTNKNMAYKRNRLRQAVQKIFKENGELPGRIAQAMQHLAQAESFIADMAENATAQTVKLKVASQTVEMDSAAFLKLHNLLQYHVLLAALQAISPKPKPPRSEAVLGVLERMRGGEKAFTLHGIKGILRKGTWYLSREEKSRRP